MNKKIDIDVTAYQIGPVVLMCGAAAPGHDVTHQECFGRFTVLELVGERVVGVGGGEFHEHAAWQREERVGVPLLAPSPTLPLVRKHGALRQVVVVIHRRDERGLPNTRATGFARRAHAIGEQKAASIAVSPAVPTAIA
mgnify:CR=1 FL=1